MKNKSTCKLLILAALVAQGIAVAAPGDNNPGLPGQVLRNTADIADNFSQIQSNRSDIMDLDDRVSDLEANGGGSSGGERSFVDVDCTVNGDGADALLTDAGASIYFPPNTTYNIHGACNGPLYVTEDGVRFVGVDGTGPAIVLPAAANPADGALFVDGANDVRVDNLLIDVSAWGSGAVAENTDAAGIYVRNSFVRVIDTRIVGGLWSINPFRNGIVRTRGLVQLEGFVNAGLSVGDQSLVSARGPLVISSSVIDGSYLVGIEAYRNSGVDLRSGVTMNLPDVNPGINLFPGSFSVTDQSQVRVRNSNPVDLKGDVFLGRAGALRIDTGSLSGSIFARDNSTLDLRNMQVGGEIALETNSTANLRNVEAEFLAARMNSSVQVSQGILNGANLDQGATANFFGTSMFGDVQLFSATYLNYFFNGTGDLHGFRVLKCGLYIVAQVDPQVESTGEVVEGCGFFP